MKKNQVLIKINYHGATVLKAKLFDIEIYIENEIQDI